MNKCKFCGKETNRKIFCSKECMYAFKRKPKNKCLNCGKEVSRCEVKFCCRKCYAEYKSKKSYETKPKFKCIICGKETLNPKYCSMKCLGKDEKRISMAIKNLPNQKYIEDYELDILKKEYGKTPIEDLAKKLNMTEQNVIATATRHKIKSSKKWKKEEEKILLDNIDKDIETLTKLLNKNKGAIIRKIMRINGFENYSAQKFISDYLKSLGCIFAEEVKINEFRTDILIKGMDIEIQGLYWHGDPRIYSEDELDDIQKDRIKKDKLKKEFFETCGIKVEYLWEWDIIRYPEQAKEKVKEIIGWPY